MDKWDGSQFINDMHLAGDETVLEIDVGTGRLATKVCGKCEEFYGIDVSPKTIETAKNNLLLPFLSSKKSIEKEIFLSKRA